MDSDRLKLIDLPKIADPRGNLSFIQSPDQIPFEIERAYWIYDVPGGKFRTGKAFHRQRQVIIALSGSFDVVTETASGEQATYSLNRSYNAIYLPELTWRELNNFSTNSVALILSSTIYDPADEAPTIDGAKELPNVDTATVRPEAKSVDDAHRRSTLADCRIVELPRHVHENGSLSVVENTVDYPFVLNRVFYLYDVPADSERGGHSHFEGQELIVAASGCFDVVLDDGHSRRTFTLNRPYQALYIPAGVWREIDNFSSGSVCMVLTSTKFAETDYCRDYGCFKILTKEKLQR